MPSEPDLYVYNILKSAKLDDFRNYALLYKPLEERQGFDAKLWRGDDAVNG